MQERGVSAEDAEQALAPNPRSAPNSEPGPLRNHAEIAAQYDRLRQQIATAHEADKPAIREQARTLKGLANVIDAVNERDRDAKGRAFQEAVPHIMESARQQVRDFAEKFRRVFAGVDEQTASDGTGGVSYNKAANRLQVSWNEIHNSAGTAYSNALKAGATVEQAREAATGKVRSILDEDLRHVADVRANGDAATKALWESLPKDVQDSTRRTYSRNNPGKTDKLSPTQLGYEFKRILSQQTSTGEFSELMAVTKQAAQNAPPADRHGWVAVVRDHIRNLVNFLRGHGADEATRQLSALHAELDRIVKSVDQSGLTSSAKAPAMPGTEHPEDSQSVSKNEADQSMELASAPEESGSDADTPANGGAKGSANGKTRKAAGRGSSLHADKPRRLPDQLRRRYSNTEFAFTKAGEKGQDVKVKGGIHPSKYRNSDWPPDVDHADFKPDTPGGRRTFKRDQATKWPEKTKMLPYNPATGKLK